MYFTIPQLFKRPEARERRTVIKFAWFPVKHPYIFGKSQNYIWLEYYYAHQFYGDLFGGQWITQYTTRMEKHESR